LHGKIRVWKRHVTEANACLTVEFNQVADGNTTFVARPEPAETKVSGSVDRVRQVFSSSGNGGTDADTVEKILGPESNGIYGVSDRRESFPGLAMATGAAKRERQRAAIYT